MPRWPALLLGFLFACCADAADRGFYVGAGYGEAAVEDQDSGVRFDAINRSYRAFLGYRLRAARFLDLAAEGTYIDFGAGSQTVQGRTWQYHLRGGELAGLVIVPLGLLDLYAKAGAVSWSSTRSIDGANLDRSGTNTLYGAGIGINVGQLGVRADWNRYDLSGFERVETHTLSFVLRFY
jgi:hypothetical protein